MHKLENTSSLIFVKIKPYPILQCNAFVKYVLTMTAVDIFMTPCIFYECLMMHVNILLLILHFLLVDYLHMQ